LEVLGFLFFVAGTHGWIVTLDKPVSTDFVSFYAAGMLANAGTPASVYQHAAHYVAEQAVTHPGIPYNFFYYPPTYLIICAAIARLPYFLSFVAFELGTLLLCLIVARGILQDRGWRMLLLLVAFPPVFFTLGTGQNAFLTAALFGAATLLIDHRAVVAGVLFGTLCYKPHFGVLVPVALVASGQWRAFLAAGVTVVVLGAVSVGMFGWDTWRAFFMALADAHSVYETGVSRAGMASPFGAAMALGCRPCLAYAIQAVATLAMVIVVFLAWYRGLSLASRAALLAAATPIAIPVVMFYDLMLSGIALTWLVRWGSENGMPRWLQFWAPLIFCTSLVSGNFNPDSHLPIAALIAGGTLTLGIIAAIVEAGRRIPVGLFP
jgi:hypothetical protein